MKQKLTDSYVHRLQEQIRILQGELKDKEQEGPSDRRNSSTRRLSGHGEQNDPAVSAEMSKPMMGLADTITSPPPYRSPDIKPISPATSNINRSDENKRYEWNETGNEKEEGTDAMGTGFKGHGSSGFFGTHLAISTYSRWIFDFVIR